MPGPIDRWLADDNFRAKEKAKSDKPPEPIPKVKCSGKCGKYFISGMLTDGMCEECWKSAHPEYAKRRDEILRKAIKKEPSSSVQPNSDDEISRVEELRNQAEKLKYEELV